MLHTRPSSITLLPNTAGSDHRRQLHKFALLSGASIVALLVNLAPVWADDLVVDPAFANSPYTAVDGDYDTVTIGDTGAGIYQRIDGQTADIMVLSDFTLGKNVGSSGQIKLDNGSTLRVVFDDGFVGRQSPQEIGTGAGTGTIEIHNGSKLILASEIGANAEESSRYILGSQTGGRMTIDVSGAGSSIETDFEGSINTTVGFAGITLNNADLTVSDGGNLTSAFTSHNSYALRNGGLVADFGSTALITGAQTTATLGALSAFHGGGITIADGAQVETKGVEAFLRPTSLFHIQGGDIHVTGAQTVVRWAGDDAFAPFTEIMADDDGTAGSLLIDGGATVQDTVLGMSVTRGSNGGSGSLTIDGAGSSYNASYAALGNVNTGAPQIITISNGGALNLDGTALITHRTPYGAGNLTLLGNARLNVDGPGSILDIRNNNWNPRGAKPGSIVFEQYDINRSENNVITVSNGGSIKAREFVTTNNEKNASRVKATINIGAAAGDAAQAAGTLDVAAINTTLTTHGYTNDRTYTDGGPGGRIDLVFNHTQNDYEFDPTILNQTHVNVVAGRTILTADNSYSAGTETHAGATLQIGAGGREGWIIGDVVNDGTTAFDREDQVDFTGSFSGSGLIEQRGAGTLRLSGDSSSFTGITNIDNGTLLVDGILGGTVNDVVDGGRIGGAGTIKQDLNVGTGGVLLGRSGQILTVDGNLTLASGSVTQVALGAPEQTGLFNVGGDLTIDGTMNVTNLNGDFGLGIYRIFNYDGTLTDNGMVLGTAEDADLSQMSIQTNVDHQVNLVYSNGDTTPVVFWDGGEASLHQNGKIDGGDGIWSLPANTNWTDQTGAVNGAWTNGAFAIFTAKPGTVRVDDSAGDIIADGMQFAVDGYKVTGDAITLSGDNVPVIRVDGGATAVVESELRGSMGLRKTDYGTLVLAGDNSYSGGTTVNEGVLQLGNGGTTGSIKGDVTLAKTDHDVGTLAFNHSNAFTFSGNITGAGDVIQNGTGLTTLAGNNAFAGGLLVARGTLQAGSNTAFGGGKLSINQGAVADLAGFGQSVTAMVNNGSFRFGGTGGTSFNVSGDYSGNNGILVMNTTLGGDASNTDRLMIGGNSAGNTTLKIVNQGGSGALTDKGIKVIDVAGSSHGDFALAGDFVTADGQQAVVGGAYAYTLHQDGIDTPTDGDWYLRSHKGADGNGDQPLFNPGVPVYTIGPDMIGTLNKKGFGGLGERVRSGDSTGAGTGTGTGAAGVKDDIFRDHYVWGRIEGNYGSYALNGNISDSNYNTNDLHLQAGMDGIFNQTRSGTLMGSVWLDYLSSQANVTSKDGDGQVNVDGYGLGTGLSWFKDNGFYLDGQAKLTWYRSKYDSSLANKTLADGVNSLGYAISLEAGQSFTLNDRWSLTPQAQLIWSSVNTDRYQDAFNASIDTPDNNSLTARFGLATNHDSRWLDADGTTTRLSLGGIANLYQQLNDTADHITLADVRLATGSIDRTWGELGVNVNYSWLDDKYAVYGKMSTATSLNNFSDSYTITGNAGFRVKW